MKNIIPNSVYQGSKMEEVHQAYDGAFLIKVSVLAILTQAELFNWFTRTPWKISFYRQLSFFTIQRITGFFNKMALQLTQHIR